MVSTADVAQGVVERLTSTVFSRPAIVQRAYLPCFDLGELLTLHVTVVAAGRTLTALSRSLLQLDHRIDVAVQQKLGGDGLAECDPLLALVGEIADHLSRDLPAPEASWVATTHAPLIAPEHLAELRQFTSVLTVTYRTWDPI